MAARRQAMRGELGALEIEGRAAALPDLDRLPTIGVVRGHGEVLAAVLRKPRCAAPRQGR